MSRLAARLLSFFLAPAGPGPDAPPRVPPSAGVVAVDRDLVFVAGAVAARLRAGERASAAVVCLWRPDRELPPVPAPFAMPAAARVATALAKREMPGRACGALCFVDLPADAAAAAAVARRAYAAVDVPFVLAAARRAPAIDELLAGFGEVVLGIAGEDPTGLEDIAHAGLASVGARASMYPAPRGAARPLAALGLRRAAAGAAPLLCEAVK